MMNIGVLGTGFGSYHARILRKLDQVGRVVVFGRNESKLQGLKEELQIEVTNCIDDIMLDPGIDIVDICLPTHLHRPYAVEALKNGKHVFCETPACFHHEDAQAMKHAEEQYGKRILVNQFIKFDAAYTYLHDAYQTQKYGKLTSLSLKRETPPFWGSLGLNSITTNLMIHELDFLTWLAESIDKFIVWGVESENKEQAQVRAFFQHSDILTEIIASSQLPESYPFTVSYEVYFEKAKLEFSESDINGQTETALLEYTQSGKREIVLENVNPYEKSIEHAIQCFKNNTESLISLDHAIQSMDIALELKKRLVQAD